MRIIDRCAFVLAKYLTERLNENHQKRRIYYYGFQIVLGGIVKVSLLVLISYILGALMPTLTLVFFFATLRSIAGGVHLDTYGKCITTSLIIFIACGVIIRYTYIYWPADIVRVLVLLVFLVSLAIMVKWAPGDTPNKPITKMEEIKKFKALSILYVCVWAIVMAIFIVFDYKMLTISASLGVIIEAFMVTPFGYQLFEGLEAKLNRVKKATG